MAFQLRRGHDGPCPLPTLGDSFGATALGAVGEVIPCTCGRVWEIQEYCLYCERIKIQHSRHSKNVYWVMVEDQVWASRVLALIVPCAVLGVYAVVTFWPF